MRIIWIISLSIILMLTIFACGEQKQSQTTSEEQTQTAPETSQHTENVYYYTCPMEEHKHVYSDKPGKCPECNMNLVAAVNATEESKEYYGCPMETHSHIRHEHEGKCIECGMQLKPMRLVKK
jgi:hypothetical protein